jgi:RecQ-mediated genome instability protein 1
MSAALLSEVTAHLVTKGLNPKPPWVSNFLASQRAGLPAAALKQTALFRLTASDIVSTLQLTPTSTFPEDVLDANVQERKVIGPVPVQVLDVEDISRSRWSQVEAIVSEERGETTRGQEIIRVVPSEENEAEGTQVSKTAGPHKLLLQDTNGTRIYGLEMSSIEGISIGMNIGTKLILKDITVARGVVLLEPQTVSVLGGKIEELHTRWKVERKSTLTAAAEASFQQ